MRNAIASRRRTCRTIAWAGVVAGSTLLGLSAAIAGECPADKFKAGVRAPVTHEAKGVTDTVLGAIDLEQEPANLAPPRPPGHGAVTDGNNAPAAWLGLAALFRASKI